jgi:hypothetical protein
MKTIRNQRRHGQAQSVLIQNIKYMLAKLRLAKSLCVGGAFLAFSMALFGQTSYTISVSSSPSAGGAAGGGGTFTAGSTNTVTATTNGGYAFAGWTINGGLVSTSNNYTFALIADVTLVATFVPATNYTISVSAFPANEGTASGDATNVWGSINTVTATTNGGYAFAGWTTSNSPVVISTPTNYIFTLTADVALVANFGPACTATVSAAPSAAGTVSGGGIFVSNSSITVTAMPSNGYIFANWTSNSAAGAVASTNASYTFTLSNGVALVANFVPSPLMSSGSEFSILGSIPGDQVLPSLSLSFSGGCIAWQDNVVDKAGGGIGASLLGGGFDAGHPFRINKVVTGIQLKPQVQLLANDNIIFVWQGSVTATGIPNIYARFAKSRGSGGTAYGTNFYTSDIQVNTYKLDQQVDPAVAALPDGSAIIAWSSYGENNGSMWGIYARRLTAAGTAKANNDGSTKQFLVTQYASYNQRNPAVTTLAGGNYVIAWVSEQERFINSVDIYTRIFTPDGVPVTDEIPVNSGSNVCHSPAVAPLTDGGFTVVWAQLDAQVPTNGWDVWGRAFSASGSPEVSDFTINTTLYGDQYAPKIAAGPSGSLVVWTSMGQDGSREGVFGRFLQGGTQVAGAEFQVNTTWISQQMHPAVAWDGVDHFLVVWTSFAGASGFDLYGQAYVLNSSP